MALALFFLGVFIVGSKGAGSEVAEFTLPVSHTRQLPPGDVFIVRDGDRFKVSDPDVDSMDVVNRRVMLDAPNLLHASFHSDVYRYDGWFPTHEKGDRRIVIEPVGYWSPPLDTEDLKRARAVYSSWLLVRGADQNMIESLQHGDQHVDRLLWFNVLLNFAGACALVLLVLSVMGTRRYVAVRRAESRLRHWRCAACKYDLSATDRGPDGVRCPECGVVWESVGAGARV